MVGTLGSLVLLSRIDSNHVLAKHSALILFNVINIINI